MAIAFPPSTTNRTRAGRVQPTTREFTDEIGRSIHFKAEARAKLQRRLRERELGLSTDAGRTTVQQFLDAWIREIVEPGDLASKTKQGYELTVRRHLVPGLGRIRLAKLTPMHVQRFINDELAAGKGRQTVQLSHAVLRIALGQAVMWGLVPRNVAQLVRGPSYRPTARRPFTHAEQTAILDAARDEDLGVAIFLVHATGMRLSEVLGQRWSDVDLDAGLLCLRHQLDSLSPVLKDVKTESGRGGCRCHPSPSRCSASTASDKRSNAPRRPCGTTTT